jgi:zinc protease
MGGLEAEARYYEEVARLTPERLREVAERYFLFDACVVTGLMPQGATFDAAEANAVLDRVARETPAVPEARRVPRARAEEPLRVSGRAVAEPGRIIEQRLASGARLIIREERAVPLVAMRAVFPGGLRYETPENNGLSTLLGRCLTRGTARHGAEEISHLIDLYAGSLSGQGGRNSVGLRGEFLSKHLRPAFSLFADCLLEPAFPEAEVARERGLLLQDILTREDKPSGLAFELFAKTLYQVHPYRLPSLGEQESMGQLGPAELRAFHAAHMDPSQLTLAVVGDVRADEVIALAQEAFGRPRGGARPPPPVPAEPPLTAPRRAHRPLTRAQSHLVLGFPGMRVDEPGRYALEVLSTLLSGQGGRLFVELRDKRSMAYSVSAFAVEGVDPGYFAVYMGTSPEKLDAALEGIRRELTRVRDEPVPEEELARARQHLIGTHEIGLQRNGARAALMALDACYGMGTDNFLHYAERVAAVSARDVRDVAQRIIDFERSALAIVGP